MLERLKLRDFRCFHALDLAFEPGVTVLVGPNAQGKTSVLEAICILARLQSPRTSVLASAIRHGGAGFLLDGHWAGRHLQFYLGRGRKKVALDSVEQKTGRDYLGVARVAWFGNGDVQIVGGGSEHRRRYLDFIGSQLDRTYRARWRTYQTALKSRNALLKSPAPNPAAIRAYDGPLVEAGAALVAARRGLVDRIAPEAAAAQRQIAPDGGELGMVYRPGAGDDFAEALVAARAEEARLRMTLIGPHRDEVALAIDAIPAALGSEGQQRTIALALRLAQVAVLGAKSEAQPVLLIDDIFGELDLARRNAFFAALPKNAQRIVTTTHLDWLESAQRARVADLKEGVVCWR
jgi:DNA replication and repair protein RecF